VRVYSIWCVVRNLALLASAFNDRGVSFLVNCIGGGSSFFVQFAKFFLGYNNFGSVLDGFRSLPLNFSGRDIGYFSFDDNWGFDCFHFISHGWGVNNGWGIDDWNFDCFHFVSVRGNNFNDFWGGCSGCGSGLSLFEQFCELGLCGDDFRGVLYGFRSLTVENGCLAFENGSFAFENRPDGQFVGQNAETTRISDVADANFLTFRVDVGI
jgi:hypothetical protein